MPRAQRLPVREHSGCLLRLDSLTVAGAVPAWSCLKADAPASRLIHAKGFAQTPEAGRILAQSHIIALTVLIAGHYHRVMDSELTGLETRLAALLAEYKGLHLENRELTTRVATLQADNKRMAEKLELVTERVEALLARLPAEDEQ